MIACPKCLSADPIIGQEIRGVYDGVLFWRCEKCGHAFQRFSPDSHRHVIAQRFIDAVNLVEVTG